MANKQTKAELETRFLRALFQRDARVQRERLARAERLSRDVLAPELQEAAA